jgi:hypothetical protein
MTNKINDSRLVNIAADIAAMEDDTIRLIDECRKLHPEVSQELTNILGYLVAAHIIVKDIAEWPVPLP